MMLLLSMLAVGSDIRHWANGAITGGRRVDERDEVRTIDGAVAAMPGGAARGDVGRGATADADREPGQRGHGSTAERTDCEHRARCAAGESDAGSLCPAGDAVVARSAGCAAGDRLALGVRCGHRCGC